MKLHAAATRNTRVQRRSAREDLRRRAERLKVRHAALLAGRGQLPALLSAKALDGTGVEIGVKDGAYSEMILDGSRLARLILVDPWTEAGDDYRDVANVAQADQDAILAKAKRRLARFGDRAEFWRMTSLDAAERVADASLDFVYIDARHDYASVLDDLEAWYPKLRPNGVFAGHDYIDGDLPEGVFGVRRAVDEFAAARGLAAFSTLENWPTWIVEPRRRVMEIAHTVAACARLARRKAHHVR